MKEKILCNGHIVSTYYRRRNYGGSSDIGIFDYYGNEKIGGRYEQKYCNGVQGNMLLLW